jgi:hypothetical protein
MSSMNPPSKENSGTQLPPAEQTPAVPQGSETAVRAPELPSIASEQMPAPQPPAAPPMVMPTTIPLPVPTAGAVPQNDVTPTTKPAGLQIEDDGDLIEKEWVNKAKQIVERTRNDPYKQSEELTVFKADYMKKRYDKTIKVSP